MTLNLDYVRSQFPGLCADNVLLDNAGGSQVLKSVAERISDYLINTNVQHGASYTLSQIAVARLQEARTKVARFVGAERPDEIAFGPGATVCLQWLARAIRGQIEAGDEIIITDFDHESNIGPWLTLQECGAVIKVWNINSETMSPDVEDLKALMTDRTKLVAMTHASNIFGEIYPVGDIAKIVHDQGAKICVDAVAYAPHRAVDVAEWDVDFYVLSFYKVYGPHFAMLYAKHEEMLKLDGLYHYFYGKDKVPAKMEPGNANYELAWGTTAIVDYIDTLGGGGGDRTSIIKGFDAIAAHEELLSERLLSWLRERDDINIIGKSSSNRALRVPTISFRVKGRNSRQVVELANEDKIGIRYGDFHSRRLIEKLDLVDGDGVIRVSMVHYNTTEEVDQLIESLTRILN
ncbi:cysteine desulfurase-like protein [Aestuariirhabdus litorea]|uniref:Cysteine desulfurase-like protein n=1 Tax=Aestuariirhabdus litorea TaxID=2528527 RepID=A0A3P3VHS9_9GAMM|nr:cysteine desulfurase-like protein [Aestuariirhabdus litorea]RRJ82270.1 cysteine desulfurase-like protein [Aestuariirhabdus litorea]RWW92436.1 cysteine desulfurase-like protein [Endozoicomonadaceae bacterium GTF-13]